MQPRLLAKRIRKNLLDQRDKLEKYLTILEFQNDDLINEDPDKLIEHINLENNIILELNSLKKLITPLEKMYYDSPYKKDDNLMELKSTIDVLTDNVKSKTAKNKVKLDTVLIKVKADLKSVNKRKMTNPAYTKVDSSVLDITG